MPHRIDLGLLAAYHPKVIDVLNMVHHHPLEGIWAIIPGEFMEGGIVVPLEGVIVIVTPNLIGIQVSLQIKLVFARQSWDCVLEYCFRFQS